MDSNNQDFQRQLNAVIDNLNRLASDTNTTATQLAEARSKLCQQGNAQNSIQCGYPLGI